MSGQSVSDQPRDAVDLKTLPPAQQIATLTLCQGRYTVTFRNGTASSFAEYDLAFKTDTSPRGPDRETPVLVRTGRIGDRAFAIFAGLDELKRSLSRCP
jgi:cytochrome c